MGLLLNEEICCQGRRSFKNLQTHHNCLSKRTVRMPKGFTGLERYQGNKLKNLKVWNDARDASCTRKDNIITRKQKK